MVGALADSPLQRWAPLQLKAVGLLVVLLALLLALAVGGLLLGLLPPGATARFGGRGGRTEGICRGCARERRQTHEHKYGGEENCENSHDGFLQSSGLSVLF